MQRIALAAVLALACLVPPAHADPPGAAGLGCGYWSTSDPTGAIEHFIQVGEVAGGPVAVADLPHVTSTNPPTAVLDTTGNPASATIVCAVQVTGNGVYTDPDATSASASGTAVVDLPPTLISYMAGVNDPVYLCTTLVLTDANGDTDTLYRDYSGAWRTDPSTTYCTYATHTTVCRTRSPVCDDEYDVEPPVVVRY